MSMTDVQEIASDAPVAIYRLYGSGDVLLWVGITQNLSDRFAQHAADKPWWPRVARKTVAWCTDRAEAMQAERAAVRDENPVYNVRLQPGPDVLPEPRRPMTSSERVRRFRERQAARIAGLQEANRSLEDVVRDLRAQLAGSRTESLRQQLRLAMADIERLEAELAARPAARCERCQGELACPRCYRAGDGF